MENIDIPAVSVCAHDQVDPPITVGIPTILINGQPFPYPTRGPVLFEYADDNVATLTVRIPIGLVPCPHSDA